MKPGVKKWNVTPKSFIADDIHISKYARKPQLYLFCLLLQHFFHPADHNYGENLATEARLT